MRKKHNLFTLIHLPYLQQNKVCQEISRQEIRLGKVKIKEWGLLYELLVKIRESKPIQYNHNNEYLGQVKTLGCLFVVDFEVTLEDFMRNN